MIEILNLYRIKVQVVAEAEIYCPKIGESMNNQDKSLLEGASEIRIL